MARDPLAKPEPLIRSVYSYVAYRIGPGPDAQDITSDAIERAIRARNSYDPARGTPVAWVIGIARRCMAEAMAARPTPTGEVSTEASDQNLEEETVTRLSLAEAIATLDERDQELLALRYGADLPARRIAEIVGLRTNTVEVALHRALGRLRHLLDDGAAQPAPVRTRAIELSETRRAL